MTTRMWFDFGDDGEVTRLAVSTRSRIYLLAHEIESDGKKVDPLRISGQTTKTGQASSGSALRKQLVEILRRNV
jgi:hypothetical protein